MYTEDYLEEHTLIEIDISTIDEDDYLSNGWALIHLTPDGKYMRGLHYVEDADFKYTDYIAEYYMDENDMVMYGKVVDYTLKVTDLLK